MRFAGAALLPRAVSQKVARLEQCAGADLSPCTVSQKAVGVNDFGQGLRVRYTATCTLLAVGVVQARKDAPSRALDDARE